MNVSDHLRPCSGGFTNWNVKWTTFWEKTFGRQRSELLTIMATLQKYIKKFHQFTFEWHTTKYPVNSRVHGQRVRSCKVAGIIGWGEQDNSEGTQGPAESETKGERKASRWASRWASGRRAEGEQMGETKGERKASRWARRRASGKRAEGRAHERDGERAGGRDEGRAESEQMGETKGEPVGEQRARRKATPSTSGRPTERGKKGEQVGEGGQPCWPRLREVSEEDERRLLLSKHFGLFHETSEDSHDLGKLWPWMQWNFVPYTNE